MTKTYSALEIATILGGPPPTAEQVRVIEADPTQPLLVIAGAGSGKTETMASRVVWLVANAHVRPEEVLGLTFTRKAAGELALRVQARLAVFAREVGAPSDGLAVIDRPTISTYNAYAAGLVTDHALRLGIEPGSRLLSEASGWQLASEVVESWTEDLDTDAAVSTVVDAVRSLAGQLAEHLLEPDEAKARIVDLACRIEATPLGGRRTAHYADVVKVLNSLAGRARLLDVVAEFAERKRASETMEFGDQVRVAARLAREVDAVPRLERSRYRAVLLDEYQDTSYAQVELLAALFGDGHGVTAVGDPNQSIYGWRGASAAGIGRFPERFRCGASASTRRGQPAPVLSLSTSWRNDLAVLEAANHVAAPLRAGSRVPVGALAARPGAGPGEVRAFFAASEQEEAAHVADVIASARDVASSQGRLAPSCAVLCRARSQFIPVETALRARGIPVEVVGLGGLLSTPEVTDLVAFLQVAHDPSRGDGLVRLLTGPRVNLGAADLYALASRARDIAARDERRTRGRGHGEPTGSGADLGAAAAADDALEPAIVDADIVDHRSLVDALDDLPPLGVGAHDGRALTPAAHERLTALASDLRTVRSQTYLSLPELVTHAERALGLDVEVDVAAALLEARSSGASDMGRAHLDAFREVAVDFSRSADVPTLGGLLAWLTAAQAKERGLELPVREIDPDAVQVITVHGAKGLEWDVVAVPGLVNGVFPTKSPSHGVWTDNAWLTSAEKLPYPLRGDAADLPHFAFEDARDAKELEDERKAFTRACGEHELAEERRLAYVALTRARRALHLSGSWWRSGSKPREPSVLLTELVDAGLAIVESWAQEPTADDSNPLADQKRTGQWPPEGARSSAVEAVRAAAARVDEALAQDDSVLEHATGSSAGEERELPADLGDGADVADLAAMARLLLAERADHDGARSEVAFPAHVSASGLVALASDRDAFALARRRPMPRQPSPHARRGTRFHAWVERYYGSSALLDVEDIPGPDDDGVLDDERLAELKATFLASPWAAREPLAIEADVETPVGGVVVRSRIDAVFRTQVEGPDGAQVPGAVVVDWKTGRAPTDEESGRARAVQLAVYRLAWSRVSGLPLDRVSAAFYYVADDAVSSPVDLLGLTELEALVRGS